MSPLKISRLRGRGVPLRHRLLVFLAGFQVALLAPLSAAAEDPSCPHHWTGGGGHSHAQSPPSVSGEEGGGEASPDGAHNHGAHSKAEGEGVVESRSSAEAPARECECRMECGEMAGPAALALPVLGVARTAGPSPLQAPATDAALLPASPDFLLPFTRPPPSFTGS